MGWGCEIVLRLAGSDCVAPSSSSRLNRSHRLSRPSNVPCEEGFGLILLPKSDMVGLRFALGWGLLGKGCDCPSSWKRYGS